MEYPKDMLQTYDKCEILCERGEGRNAENRVRDKGKQAIHGNILCITNCTDEVYFYFHIKKMFKVKQ